MNTNCLHLGIVSWDDFDQFPHHLARGMFPIGMHLAFKQSSALKASISVENQFIVFFSLGRICKIITCRQF